ncbi:histidine phosphatase family protein [Photobacterium sp. 1_MG-2023]|uniref:SixA phosphatase family protein n=1 Tax=Photobacterium sp. 1_MG-2023 TaxID=3062646 RepID=UPI0026E12763|nr:histidine phosphatase family protein [Photobacterium sp. 1_MG-2023]MDO6706907.1 histidine phosphatase family protein [Photobacterium sp. 1_MG-2023]
MKLLFVVRHAKSSWDNPDLDDHDRPLNERGLKNAEEMAKRFGAWLAMPQRILSSTAERAFQTAQFFEQGLHPHPTELATTVGLYTDSAHEVAEIIQSVSDEIDRLMVVCHNPAINELVGRLGLKIENMPTCGVAVFAIHTEQWKNLGPETSEVIFFDYPKRLLKPEKS